MRSSANENPVKPLPAHSLRKPLKSLAKNIHQVCRLFPRSAHNRSMVEPSQSVRRAVFSAKKLHARYGGMHTVWTRYGKGMYLSLKPFAIKYGGMPYRGAGGRSKKGGVKPDKPAFDERTRKIFGPLFPLLHSPLVPEPVLSAVEAFLPFRNRVPTAPHRYLFAGSLVQMHTNTRSNL